MTAELDAFLSDLNPQLQEEQDWGEIRLSLSVYLTESLPPLDLVSSVRAVVLKDDYVVTVRTRTSAAILPGGRVNPRNPQSPHLTPTSPPIPVSIPTGLEPGLIGAAEKPPSSPVLPFY